MEESLYQKVIHRPAPRYEWIRTDGRYLNAKPMNFGRILRIDNARADNAGRYLCIAINELGQDSAEINLAFSGYFFNSLSI